MSKERIVEIYEQNGSQYGQISSPNDLVKAQEYAHAHTELVTQDFLTQVAAEIAGCEISLSTGLTVEVDAGRIYRGGLQYESQDQTLTMSPADLTYKRIDLVVAVLAADVPSNTEFVAFQRLRTEQELNDNVPSYPPTQFQRASERRNMATLTVKTGAPAVNPTAPGLAANEVGLYEITVLATASNLNIEAISDTRNVASNLRIIDTQVKSILESIATIERKLFVLKYRFPTIGTSGGRCPAAVVTDGINYFIDIPVGMLVEFGDQFVYVQPLSDDLTMHARFVSASNPPEIDYQSIFEGESIPGSSAAPQPTGNVIRINAPTTQKWLYLGYDGKLFFRNTPEPSGKGQCLLLRITPQSNAAPVLKSYRNLRESRTDYFGTYHASDPTSKQFELDIAMNPGYIYPLAFGVKPDNTMYIIPYPVIVFDSVITVEGLSDGDRWWIELTTLSAL